MSETKKRFGFGKNSNTETKKQFNKKIYEMKKLSGFGKSY
jgi:hypothetical protein